MASPKPVLRDFLGANARTLGDHAFWALYQAIVTGVLEPGERLRIDDLADQLKMSAMPILPTQSESSI